MLGCRATHNDEMCNFYMMYYTDSKKGSVAGVCSSNSYKSLLKNLPPGFDEQLPDTPNFGQKPPMQEEEKSGKKVPHSAPFQRNNERDYPSYWPRGRGRDMFNYDYDSNSYGQPGDRDDFYYQVENQRSRYRRPDYDTGYGYERNRGSPYWGQRYEDSDDRQDEEFEMGDHDKDDMNSDHRINDKTGGGVKHDKGGGSPVVVQTTQRPVTETKPSGNKESTSATVGPSKSKLLSGLLLPVFYVQCLFSNKFHFCMDHVVGVKF